MYSLRSVVLLVFGMAVLFGAIGCDSDAEAIKGPPTPPAPPQSKTTQAESADAQSQPKEGSTDTTTGKVPFPKLPDGAGEIDADAPEEFTKTESGLKFRILRKAEGRKPVATSEVVAHYKGWLDNGKQFDSSYDRHEPTAFPLDGVIPGWTEGLQLIGEGAMIELDIPSELAYGPRGRPGIPPNSTLHFIVELKQVK
jgi:FKBP-type peptidyl-prolyl cis-trans isomerase FkpA